jgi:hypothetical protein
MPSLAGYGPGCQDIAPGFSAIITLGKWTSSVNDVEIINIKDKTKKKFEKTKEPLFSL